jgi:MFS family permease
VPLRSAVPHPRGVVVAGTRSPGFWLIVLAATAGYTVLSASAPLLNRGVTEVLGLGEDVSGGLVAVTGLTGAASMALAGVAASRFGPRAVTLVGAVVAVLGVAVVLLAFTVPALAVSRVVHGLGNAGVTVATTAWISGTAPPDERGRALGYYGISVWVGLALGPLLGENLYAAGGNGAAWAGLLVVQAVVLLLASGVRGVGAGRAAAGVHAAARPARDRRGAGRVREVAAAVRVPGLVALSAWGAQGLFTTFLVQHLEARGLPPAGATGASAVFLVFAAAVVTFRFVLGSLPDRAGPAVTTRWALLVVALGLVVMASAGSFGFAAAGAVVLGLGYAPLYPSLTLMSTAPLPEALRPTGIGLFSAATSAGMAAGAFGGGLLVASWGTAPALLCAAAVQVAAVAAVRRPRAVAGA